MMTEKEKQKHVIDVYEGAEKRRFEKRTRESDSKRQWRMESERAAVPMRKLQRMETDVGMEVNVESFSRWEKTCSEMVRFETRMGDDIRGQRTRDSERVAARIKLPRMGHDADIGLNIERFRELGSEVMERWDGWEENRCAEKTRFETRKGDDVRRQQPRDSERCAQARNRLRRMEVKERWDRWEKNRCAEKTRLKEDNIRRQPQRDSERAAAWMKVRWMENNAGIELNVESFRELESEVMERWDGWEENQCAEKMWFETRKGDDNRRQQPSYSERGAARIRLRKMEVEERWDRWEKNRCAEKTRFDTRKEDNIRRQPQRESERAAAQMKLQRMENDGGIELNVESFREMESEVKMRWDKTRCAEKETRFETRTEADNRRQQKSDSERAAARIKLRKMEHTAGIELDIESSRELKIEEKERWDRQEKNQCAEKTRFETLKEADIRRQQQRNIEVERAAARIKLQKMENTAKIEQSHESFRELEYLSGCSLSFVVHESQFVTGVIQGSRFWNPLEQFGLKIKDECYLDDDDDDAILKKAESHLEETNGDNDMIVDKTCKNSPDDDSMPSDDKALRAAMLKSRYSEIITKAQQKTLFK